MLFKRASSVTFSTRAPRQSCNWPFPSVKLASTQMSICAERGTEICLSLSFRQNPVYSSVLRQRIFGKKKGLQEACLHHQNSTFASEFVPPMSRGKICEDQMAWNSSEDRRRVAAGTTYKAPLSPNGNHLSERYQWQTCKCVTLKKSRRPIYRWLKTTFRDSSSESILGRKNRHDWKTHQISQRTPNRRDDEREVWMPIHWAWRQALWMRQ